MSSNHRLVKDVLAEHAKFLVPRISHTTGSLSSSAVNQVLAESNLSGWKPRKARRADGMVDSLLADLDKHLNSVEVQSDEEYQKYLGLFTPLREVDGLSGHVQSEWRSLKTEDQVQDLIKDGAIHALSAIVGKLYGISPFFQKNASMQLTSKKRLYTKVKVMSNVDFTVSVGKKRILVEVKEPTGFDKFQAVLDYRTEVNIRYIPSLNVEEKILSKVAYYMGLFECQYLALTSHEKWYFFQLVFEEGRPEPYLAYSSLEKQEDNTRPFRALLSMFLNVLLPLKPEDWEALEKIPKYNSDESGSDQHIDTDSDPENQGSTPKRRKATNARRGRPARGRRAESSTSRSKPRLGTGSKSNLHSDSRLEPQPQSKPNSKPKPKVTTNAEADDMQERVTEGEGITSFLISWAPNVSDRQVVGLENLPTDGGWQAFQPYNGTEYCTPLRRNRRTAHLRVKRYLGGGETGEVFEAKLAGLISKSRYAVKIVNKGSRHEDRIKNEFHAYLKIENAKRTKQICLDRIAPTCYGLYESKFTYALLLDYGGKALREKEWLNLSRDERIALLDTFVSLHSLNIAHCDIAPRNVLRRDDGFYMIIDFSEWCPHECQGIPDCGELQDLYMEVFPSDSTNLYH